MFRRKKQPNEPLGCFLIIFLSRYKNLFKLYEFNGFPSQAALAASLTASEYVGCP